MRINTHPCGPAQSNLGAADFLTLRVRAIVVDDNPEMVAIANELLASAGHVEVVATASNGTEAVSAVRMFDPDLVLMDINMPHMNGLAAAMQIREISSQTRILIMSSEDRPDVGLAALDCGADGFVSKERLIQEVPHYLHRWFSSDGVSRDSRTNPAKSGASL